MISIVHLQVSRATVFSLISPKGQTRRYFRLTGLSSFFLLQDKSLQKHLAGVKLAPVVQEPVAQVTTADFILPKA